ncbi:MAG: hypothetical protein WAK85_18115, partial [Xanthobacteraceae bacterium]
RKAAVAVRPPFYLFGQQIVSLPCALDRLRGIFLDLHAGPDNDSTANVTPAASMAASRSSPKSESFLIS